MNKALGDGTPRDGVMPFVKIHFSINGTKILLFGKFVHFFRNFAQISGKNH